MSKSIRISDELLNRAREEAERFHRSPPQQIEHWAEIGRVLEPALSYGTSSNVKKAATKERIEEALAMPGTPEGILRARTVINRTSTPVRS